MASVTGIRTGQQLGNYQLQRGIGRGGFAEVYLAEHVYLKTQAAVKVLYTQLSKEDQASFLREAQTIARLKHPNILSVLEFGVEQDVPFLVMDYAPKGSLCERYPERKPLSPISILPYIKQAAAALQYAHQEHVVHRDVKPENLLLGAQDELLLSDFGLSLGTQTSRTQNMDEVAGTVAYMAPEQLRGEAVPASDQYSLAIIVYEWLSGDVPFHGSFSEIASQQVMAAPPPIKSPAVSPEVEAVLQQALSKRPEQRFASVQAFAETFEQAVLDVDGTLRAPTGWLPPSVYPQLPTISPVEAQKTVREPTPSTQPFPPTLAAGLRPAPTVVAQHPAPTLPAPVSPPKEPTRSTRRPPLALFIGLIVLAVLVVIGGVAYLGLHMLQPGAQPQGKTSAQTGITVAQWQERYNQVTSQPAFFSDTLNQNTNQWDAGAEKTRACFFKGGTYHVSSLQAYNTASCTTKKLANLSNTAFQVEMSIVSGNEGGIFLRLSVPEKGRVLAYFFDVNSNGSYNLWSVNTHFKTLLHGTSPAIKTGLNQPNLITGIAQGKQIALYINKQYIASITDDTSAIGFAGLSARSLSDTTEVAFSNVAVWRL